jgi:hypothetical protein
MSAGISPIARSAEPNPSRVAATLTVVLLASVAAWAAPLTPKRAAGPERATGERGGFASSASPGGIGGAGGGDTTGAYVTAAKLIASDGVSRDALGEVALSADGSTAAVAAPDAKIGGQVLQGAVYVFVKAASGWSGGGQRAKLVASDGAAGDRLGPVAISADGGIIVAGSRAAVGGHGGQGAVYVFVRAASGWANGVESAKLTVAAGAANDNLGAAVGISADGTTVVAGAPGATFLSHSGQGVAYLFFESGGGWASTNNPLELIANDGEIGDRLGSAVAASSDGSVVVAGAPGAAVGGHSSQGALYVFVKRGGAWTSSPQAARLTAADGATNDGLGSTAALSGDGATAVAGTPAATVDGHAQQGAAYVFVEPGAGWANATAAGKLTASSGATADRLAGSLALSGDGSTVLAGAPGAAVNGDSGQGAAYVFLKPGAGWATETEMAELGAPDGAASDAFGFSVSLSGDGVTALIGEPAATIGNNQFQGAAYVLTLVSGGPCLPGTNTLCIDDQPGDRRWAVGVTFSSPQASGTGEAIALAPLGVADGGLFWFFDPTNPEMLFKILDACALNQSFWVFYSATTNVGFVVNVRDTRTGRTRTYSNQDGTAAVPVQDTSAFACENGDDRPAVARSQPPLVPVPAASAAAPTEQPAADAADAGDAADAACTTGGPTLCIAGRFQIKVNYRSTTSGAGTAVNLSSLGVTQGGLFWFFAASNPEMLVKVLDGCALNHEFWLFYAATTNVGFTLTATDTSNGATRVYRNAIDNTAPPVLDTAAFACN